MGIKRLSYILIGITLSLIMLFTAVDLVAFNRAHYLESFIKHQIPQVTGRNIEDLQYFMEDLLTYLKDDRELLDTVEIVNGEEIQVFGERAVLHMVDVKVLFVRGRWIRNVSIPILILLLFYLMKKDRGWKKSLAKTLYYTTAINVMLLLTLFILMQIDFYKYFTYFHLIFFDNDLWILDPSKEILIQMLPEEFFFESAIKIIAIYMLSLFTLGGIGYWYYKKR
ncbi:TIGR01906 family membrane protein [Alkaliphilus peptidifermentans]|uniref:Integral membrane protein TIGR01906 n=1 Tax=Alkaliphilus peptidifermentans DSM 18978 TaxID=1120976 RepID=A0A1G5L1W2_9FIRM|nr:TIGR01906 family membrane protein [Alkaliphilus peptidifermentans]SCZ06847.1 integral membrane protein TIGR01906 [Alkaliphilus peptidifermentans DSM 18978]